MPYTRMRRLAGTYDQWQTANPVLLPAEAGYEDQQDGTYKVKIGDGISHWKDLPYAVDYQAILAAQNAAAQSKDNAATSEENALASKNAAADSASAALASQNAAKGSEDSSAVYAAAALSSKNAAGTSESNALVSKNAAADSASAAGVSATNAANSAAAALVSQNAAKTSENSAKTSENNAAATLANAVQTAVQTFTNDQKKVARQNIGIYGTPGGFSFSMAADKSMVVGYTDPSTQEVYAASTMCRETTAQALADTTTVMAGYMRTIAET